MKMLNAHPSLLPKYRGASPLQYTIMNEDPVGGVSIIDLDSRTFDAGNIWARESFAIEQPIDVKVLEEKTAKISGKLFHGILKDYTKYDQSKKPQEGPITMAPKIERSQAFVSFERDRMMRIYSLYQALKTRENIHCKLATGEEVMIIEMLDPRNTYSKMHPQQFHDLTGTLSILISRAVIITTTRFRGCSCWSHIT